MLVKSILRNFDIVCKIQSVHFSHFSFYAFKMMNAVSGSVEQAHFIRGVVSLNRNVLKQTRIVILSTAQTHSQIINNLQREKNLFLSSFGIKKRLRVAHLCIHFSPSLNHRDLKAFKIYDLSQCMHPERCRYVVWRRKKKLLFYVAPT